MQPLIVRFDTNCCRYLSGVIDWFDVVLDGRTVEAGLVTIKTPSNLFPVRQQKEMGGVRENNGLKTTFVGRPVIQRHDAFLIDEARFAPVDGVFFLEF